MSEWRPIDTAPVDCDFLAFGSYVYEGDKHPTEYIMIAERTLHTRYPWLTHEGHHPPDFFSHWTPLPPKPVIVAQYPEG